MNKSIVAKKKFGQNFLKDHTIIDKIIESMPKDKHIVEIGPGLGDLTNFLVKYKSVTAYEVDRELYKILCHRFKDEIANDKLYLILSDVLEEWSKIGTLWKTKFNLIANLPYYIATNIILRAFDDVNCETIVVMVQKEVAEKFSAKCGEKSFSALGVMSNIVSRETKILFDVPPTSFEPQPKVFSSVLYIKKDLSKSLSDDFKRFLKTAFSQPRKILIKNLSFQYDKNLLKDMFLEFEIKENIRPHQLETRLYSLLFERMKEYERRDKRQHNDTGTSTKRGK